MTWTPRDERRWGSRVTLTRAPTLGAVTVATPELCRAEGPSCATWQLIGQVRGVDPADQAGMTWNVVVTLGVGAVSEEFRVAFNPALPWTAVLLPAQWVSVQVEAIGAIAVGGNWTFSALAAPMTQWSGTQTEVEVSDNGE